jgi:hypothetical protein
MVQLKNKENILVSKRNNMIPFKDYIKTDKGKKELSAYLKKHPNIKQKIKRMMDRVILPQSKESRHMDPSNMGATNQLPAATQGNQPGMS